MRVPAAHDRFESDRDCSVSPITDEIDNPGSEGCTWSQPSEKYKESKAI